MHETIEGEVILIDLKTGSYYSLRETGADIWQFVEQGADESQMVEALTNGYEESPEEIRSAVAKLLEELSQEGLIGPAEEDTAAAPIHVVSVGNATRRSFRAPVLEKHTDMRDLILLDPVHDVDPRGWPHRAEPKASA